MITLDSLIEVKIAEEEDFLKIKETLTRIGIASRKDNKTLFQSCHILHKQGKYYIVHFKELFALDGKPTDFTPEDVGRRNKIAQLLEDWDLIKIVEKDKIKDLQAPMSQIKVIPHKEKGDWNLETKYNIGRKKKD
jgi:hypothetical protein